MKQPLLPNKLSELLRLAVSDCRKVEKLENYKLDMSRWFKLFGGVCHVCMAGAVMDRTLKARSFNVSDLRPGYYNAETGKKLQAINYMREGMFEYAFRYINSKPTPSLSDIQVDAIEEASEFVGDKRDSGIGRAAWKDYLKAAQILEKVGL